MKELLEKLLEKYPNSKVDWRGDNIILTNNKGRTMLWRFNYTLTSLQHIAG